MVTISTNILLYTSHALSRWGDRMWSFAIGIFLIYLHPQSLMLTAIYGFIVQLFGCCLSGAIGRKVDSLPRLATMRTSLVIQNSSVALAAILIVVSFQLQITYYCKETLFFVFMTLVTLLGVVSTLSSSATKMIIERDWIVVLSKNDPKLLSSINANMRRIDQICLLLAPILAGAFMTALNTTWAAGLIAVWNIVSFFFEYSLLRAVYSRVPALANKKTPQESPERDESKRYHKLKRAITSYLENVKIFLSQKVALIGICLSLVYLTVLGFGSITVGYLRLNNVNDLYVGIAMAAGASVGVLGTICYTPFTKRFGVSASGALGAFCLMLSYGVCFGTIGFSKDHINSITVPNITEGTCGEALDDPLEISGPITTPTIMLLVGITTIRFGLWMYDLAISQSFQQSVPEHQRTTVGGVQTSFNSFFDCTYILLTVFMSDLKQFDILITISCTACIGSCILYLAWYLMTGGLLQESKADYKEVADNYKDECRNEITTINEFSHVSLSSEGKETPDKYPLVENEITTINDLSDVSLSSEGKETHDKDPFV